MKRSENQSLYKALPGQYISYEMSPLERKKLHFDKAVIKISFWNKTDVSSDEIYKPKIVNQVASSMSDFLMAQQDDSGSSYEIDGPLWALITSQDKTRVRLMQAKISDSQFNDDSQIFGQINPKMFYCQKCGKIKIIDKTHTITDMVCDCSGRELRMMQYERVWVCGCGKTSPIDYFDIEEGDRYFASHQDGVVDKTGHDKRLTRLCPDCQKPMSLVNATDSKAFFPRTITTIKLYNNSLAKLCEDDNGCKLILKKHKHEILKSDFENEARKILEKNQNTTNYIGNMAANNILGIFMNGLNTQADNPSNEPTDKTIIYKVLEYDTLEEKKIYDMENATKKELELNGISNATVVSDLASKLKIKDIYSVSDIEIINTAYGYTRCYSSPENVIDNRRLKLCAFVESTHPGIPIFYNVRNKTEGIVINIDAKEMYKYLAREFSGKFNLKKLKEESEIKDWFLNKDNIDPDLIKHFSDVELDGTMKASATKIVYTILHTISHIAIQSISKYSGIDKDSLTEMVFPNLCSILIYAQTNQAVVLGAITSMFEKQIYELLKSIHEDMQTCSFDPICMDTTNGSCLACVYSAEAACEHFNKDLSRRYLYGYHNNNERINGFWEIEDGNNASE